jgi:hypothetical protein
VDRPRNAFHLKCPVVEAVDQLEAVAASQFLPQLFAVDRADRTSEKTGPMCGFVMKDLGSKRLACVRYPSSNGLQSRRQRAASLRPVARNDSRAIRRWPRTRTRHAASIA